MFYEDICKYYAALTVTLTSIGTGDLGNLIKIYRNWMCQIMHTIYLSF